MANITPNKAKMKGPATIVDTPVPDPSLPPPGGNPGKKAESNDATKGDATKDPEKAPGAPPPSNNPQGLPLDGRVIEDNLPQLSGAPFGGTPKNPLAAGYPMGQKVPPTAEAKPDDKLSDAAARCNPRNESSTVDALGRNKTYTNVYGMGRNSTNALGKVGDYSLTVGSSPFRIQRCDQVLLIDGEELPDIDNYVIRKPAFYTLSAYFLNLFSERRPDKLRMSIHVKNIKVTPVILQGSKSCMIFRDSSHISRNITMCLNSECDAKDIIQTFKELKNCRLGKNSKIDYKLLFANCFLGKTGGVINKELFRKIGMDLSEDEIKGV